MIIETLTAFSAVKIIWETPEILHFLRMSHETGRDGYKAGNLITVAVQKQLQKIQYKKDPVLQTVQEVKTHYDFQATGDATKAIREINKDTKNYLTAFNNSLGILNDAKRYFSKTHRSLEKLVNALDLKDEQEFLSHLSKFKINFESF